MSVRQLRSVRDFFADRDGDIDSIISVTFRTVFAMRPETMAMFPADMQAHQQVFATIFRKLIELTRNCYLWPVSVQTGSALLPGIECIRARHDCVGVVAEHFAVLKVALIYSLEQHFPQDFDPELRAAFTFVYDVLAKSLASGGGYTDELAELQKLSTAASEADAATITLSDVMRQMPEY